MSKPFANQVNLRVAAKAIGIEYDTLRKWRQRFGLFGVPGEPKRELSVPEVCGLRVAVIALRRCRGISVIEALDVSTRLAVGAFEELLSGEIGTEAIVLGNSGTGIEVIVSCGDVVADVLPRLGLGVSDRAKIQPSFVHRNTAARLGKAGQGLARLGRARQGWARRGQARQG